MKSLRPLFSLLPLVLLLCTLSVATADERHLFIFSGQSNMSRMKPKQDFLPEAAKQLPGAKVEHVKVASPGKPIRNWLAQWDALAAAAKLNPAAIREGDKEAGSPYYQQILDQTLPLLRTPPTSVTFIWMQGESDTKGGAQVVYEAALNALIANLRRDLGTPEMNVVICRISDYGSDPSRAEAWPGWENVRKAQESVVAADDRAALVNTDDCNGPKDGLHYPREGYQLMGQRMARQAATLIKATKGSSVLSATD